MVSKPARASSAARSRTRAVFSPEGSPMMSVLPKWCCTKPGSLTEQLACTTQPMMCFAGTARAIAPSGSTAFRREPSNRPPKPSKNHHGTPFIAVSTMVSGPIEGRDRECHVGHCRRLHRYDDQVLHAEVGGAGRDVRTQPRSCRQPACNRSPWRCNASSVAPRATTPTLHPERASFTPSQPPIAPAP